MQLINVNHIWMHVYLAWLEKLYEKLTSAGYLFRSRICMLRLKEKQLRVGAAICHMFVSDTRSVFLEVEIQVCLSYFVL
jgi:hypothetical protein